MFDAKYEQLYIDERTVKEINAFWEYFVQDETQIINALYSKNKEYLSSFENRLEKVFFRYEKKLRFSFEKRENIFYFTIFYGRNSYLLTVGNELFSYKQNKLKNEWAFELKK